jgi:cysteine synthase B
MSSFVEPDKPEKFRPFFEKAPLLALIGNTPLVSIPIFQKELPHCRFFAKLESVNPGGSIKDRPVRRMFLEALLSGELGPGKTLIDSSSGNAGISYAMLGAALGIDVELVVPGNASLERKRRIVAHGAKLVETPAGLGYDEALREAHRRHHADPNRYFMPDQYRNLNNVRAHYEETAEEILRDIGNAKDTIPEGPIYFIAGVGTGGTITGVGRRLKEVIKGVRVVMACPELFPGIEGLKPLDQPGAIIPDIFDPTVVDEKVQVQVEESLAMATRIACHMGLFVGQSSGAFLKAAYDVACREKQGTFITVFSDLGERYFSAGLWGTGPSG